MVLGKVITSLYLRTGTRCAATSLGSRRVYDTWFRFCSSSSSNSDSGKSAGGHGSKRSSSIEQGSEATSEPAQEVKPSERTFPSSGRLSDTAAESSAASENALSFVDDAADATDFGTAFEGSPMAAEIKSGTLLRGRIVAAELPYIRVDFGLKREVPFLPAEVLGEGRVGDEVIMPLIATEDDFQEPVLDYSGQYYKPLLVAERYRLWEPPPDADQEKELDEGKPRFLFGRVASLKRGGFNAKILGIEAFLPRKQSLILVRRDDASSANPFIGSYMPFVLLSTNFFVEGASPAPSAASPSGLVPGPGGRPSLSAYGTKRVRVLPVVSNYASFLYILVELVRNAEKYSLSPDERLAYLRLLARVIWSRNHHVRRFHVTRTMPRVNTLAEGALAAAAEGTLGTEQALDVQTSGAAPAQDFAAAKVVLEKPFSETRGSAVAENTLQSRRKRASMLRELAEKKSSSKKR
jgi:hypothetical protein